MSAPEPLRNDPYAWIEGASEALDRAAAELVREGDAARVSDEAVARLFTAAIRLYAAKTDGEDRTFRPLTGPGADPVSPTELLTAVSELLRALRLGPMELALWFRRRPEDATH